MMMPGVRKIGRPLARAAVVFGDCGAARDLPEACLRLGRLGQLRSAQKDCEYQEKMQETTHGPLLTAPQQSRIARKAFASDLPPRTPPFADEGMTPHATEA